MSLFDTIKYPLSYPPTEEELLQLPEDLYKDWVNSSDWKNHKCTPAWIAKWYRIYIDGVHFKRSDEEDLARLKQMIKDYDSNEHI